MIISDNADVYIPFAGLEIKPGKGDLIIRGNIHDDLSNPDTLNLKELRSKYQVREILYIETCDYGSKDMQHWEVIAE